jgi:catechol 2,3-dioxygenase-like lactoylglutathione lyase family enzyme
MFHATAMVADYDATLAPLAHLFGARVLHDNVVEDEGIGRRGGMTWIGDGSLEIGEPAGERSPVRAFVDRFGGGMHSVGIQVADCRVAKEHLLAHGARIASEPHDGMLWTHPGDTAGILLEWYSLAQGDDPRWGAPVPTGPAPVVAVDRLAFVTAEVDDPPAAATRVGELTCTPSWELDGWGDLAAAVSLVDCTLAFVRRREGRPRVCGLGLAVASLDDAERALAAEGVRAVARADHVLVLDPAALPVPIALTDRLLPGDPRT